MDSMDLSYIAGFFDGEGSVGIYYGGPRRSQNYHNSGCYGIRTAITNADKFVLEWMMKEFGGRISKKPIYSVNHNQCWEWYLSAKQACVFMIAILPFIRVKRRQINLAIRFQRECQVSRKGKARRLTNYELKHKEWYRQVLSRIKNRRSNENNT